MAPPAPSKLVARIAVVGVFLAVASLGALAVWSAIVTQDGADRLTKAGVQTSGHLRAVQALGVLDTQTDGLNGGSPRKVARVRRAVSVLDDALDRMESGGNPGDSRLARETKPIVGRLKPALERYRVGPSGGASLATLEERMDEIIANLQVRLNDLGSDPGLVLAKKLDAVTATERTVRTTAFVLIPLGLGGVAACGWLLGLYRRRSEAVMRSAIEMTAEGARTDELTGLPNRRSLMEQLESRTREGQPFTLALADLNGFKRYNDTFGHAAGDALLRRLSLKLAAACDGHGMAARLGGDEFCVLFFGEEIAVDPHALLSEALRDEGEGFEITAASGMVAVPGEAGDPEGALRLADARMYAAKVSGHPSAEQAMAHALTRMLDEHHPGLGEHVHGVAALSAACAETLGLSTDEVQSVRRAAELHDLGKVAIPSAILTKERSLSDEEWDFMRRHSIIGERILCGVPSLEDVAAMVRSSHERWDGGGYPDGLAGEEIPIGARVIFVADAFCAMIEDRPYAKARSVESARKELLACAGTQFDPDAVKAFLAALDRQEAAQLSPAAT